MMSHQQSKRFQQSGFTLVEAMISVTVLGILFLASSQMYINTNRAQNLIEIQSEQRDNLNSAERKLRNILSHAIYYFETAGDLKDILPDNVVNVVGTTLASSFELPGMPYQNNSWVSKYSDSSKCQYYPGNALYFISSKSKELKELIAKYPGTLTTTWNDPGLYRSIEIHVIYLRPSGINDNENPGLFDLVHYQDTGFYERFSKNTSFSADSATAFEFYWKQINGPSGDLATSNSTMHTYLRDSSSNNPNLTLFNSPSQNNSDLYYDFTSNLFLQNSSGAVSLIQRLNNPISKYTRTEVIARNIGSHPRETNIIQALPKSVEFFRQRNKTLQVRLNSQIYSHKLRKTVTATQKFDVFPRSLLGNTNKHVRNNSLAFSNSKCL